MAVIFAKAPGKIILLGEHAVVYGQPAIAIPVSKVNATARVTPLFEATTGQLRIQAPDIHLDALLTELPDDHPLAAAVSLTLAAAGVDTPPALTLQVNSTIPRSAGMGSSAAISIAIIRALSDFLGTPLTADQTSTLAYEVEKIHHGTPSGIDNHVIAHQKPVFFTRGKAIEHINVEQPTHWVIADSGEKTPTRETVADVRKLYDAHPDTCQKFFNQIGEITREARQYLVRGAITQLGTLINENQQLLESINVSSPILNNLISVAIDAGAAGAKLSGGGRGGNIIALSTEDQITSILTALQNAGAQQVITTVLAPGLMPE